MLFLQETFHIFSKLCLDLRVSGDVLNNHHSAITIDASHQKYSGCVRVVDSEEVAGIRKVYSGHPILREIFLFTFVLHDSTMGISVPLLASRRMNHSGIL